MKKSLILVITILTILSVVAICFAISGLILWGIGCLVIEVFNISYEWTFLHGLCTALILWILASWFK